MKSKHSLTIASRFALVLVIIVPVMLAVGATGLFALRSARGTIVSLYQDHVRNAQNAANLGSLLDEADEAALVVLLPNGGGRARAATSQLYTRIVPDVDAKLPTVFAESSNDRVELAHARTMSKDWTRFEDLLVGGNLSRSSPAAVAPEAERIEAVLGEARTAAVAIESTEVDQAHQSYANALAGYHDSVWSIVIVLLAGLAASIGVVIWLIRSVLSRTLDYSSFAARVTEGDFSRRLSPRGGDELADLGRRLDVLARHRQSEEDYARLQLEFTDSLQLTEGEQEAHELLKRYLERALDGGEVTILNRNNSADRLEAVTTLQPGSALASGLEGAKPRSCLAVRMARIHSRSAERQSFLQCQVCGACPGRITCTPLLVGGQVIGSVVANHAEPLSDTSSRSIREAVTVAAPVLGNLRNLAIAELRASTDSLTGLPNRRALQDTLKRMVAQSDRTAVPLAAIMCDLDHFKNINDEFGHSRGDEVLAAVGATLPDMLRSTDFAGRFGGEEFLVLLPATSAEGALFIAEKIHAAVAGIRVPAVDQRITLSIGIAVLPDHADDADSLERAADRALYAAKSNGRDRVEVCQLEQVSPLPPVAHNGTVATSGVGAT